MKKLKKISIVIGVGFCIGVILVIMKNIFHVEDDIFWRWYFAIAAVVIIGAVVFNLCYNYFYLKKARKLMEQLWKDKPLEYVEKMKELRKTAKGKGLKFMLDLNLAFGYIAANQFHEAIAILEPLSQKKPRSSQFRMIQCLELSLSYFKVEQYENALKVYKENTQLFAKYRGHKIYGAQIALLDILAALIEQQYQKAEELLKKAMEIYQNPYMQQDFREISSFLQKVQREGTDIAD